MDILLNLWSATDGLGASQHLVNHALGIAGLVINRTGSGLDTLF